MGDIKGLAETIKDECLLEPIVITEDKTLVCGARRLEACKLLGCSDIPFTIVPIKDLLKGELYENNERKNWTISERIAILEEIESQRLGHRQRKDSKLESFPTSFQNENKNKRSVDIAAKYLGISQGQLAKEKKIVEAARDEPEKYGHLLQRVEEKQTSVEYVAKMITRAQDHKDTPPLPEGQFDVIVADPPWKYDINSGHGTAESHYQVMENEEIEQLPIPAADNAILFLWATQPLINQAFPVMAAWGFEYKAGMVWVKDKIRNGYYVRGKHELLLIGVKGDMPLPEESNRPHSVIEAARQEHSKKPEKVYEMIEKMYPNRKYLELFARSRYNEKWTVWGSYRGGRLRNTWKEGL